MAAASSASDLKTENTSTVNTTPVMDKAVMESKETESNSPKDMSAVPVKREGGSLEENFNKFFVSPMLAEMEKNVQKNTEILDRINQQMENERKEKLRKTLSAHIPEALKGSGQKIESIMETLEELIIYDDNDERPDDKRSAVLHQLDKHGHASILAHSIGAYVSTLDEEHLKRFTTKITSDCQLWLSRLFRFTDSSVVYHEEEREGLVKVVRLALYQKFPKYATEGYDALYSRPPVIYISSAAKPGLGHYLCLQLGLPLSCICTVPCNTMFGGSSKMDVSMLEKLIQDDISAAKKPTLLIGFAGTPLVGQVDNLQRLQEICKDNSIWLHIEGNNLATLMMFSVPSSIQSAKAGDSMTVDLSHWLGIPGLPYATLYKTPEANLAHAAGLSSFNPRLKLSCLPIWICLQSLGHDGIVSRIKNSTNLAKKLFEHLEKITTIKEISREKKEKEKEITSVGEIISRAINALLVFEIVTPTVVFRYAEDAAGPGAIVASYASNAAAEDNSTSTNTVYYNALNTWLVETLQSSVPKVPVTAVDVSKEGICIRYSPLETSQFYGTTEEDLQTFVDCLKENLTVLDATVAQRLRFRSIIEKHSNLVLVELSTWAGLGAVRYIPDHWMNQELTEKAKRDVSNINSELVHKLKSMDTAFSTGHGDDDEICVRFGLITASTDVEELVTLVYSTGKEIEESSKYLESMSEIIRKSIDVANQELQKESVEKLMQEGVIRQVPLVGSLWNWFSPPKDPSKGRTFNLNSGTIESTESIYKYHMQIQPGTAPSTKPGVKKALIPDSKSANKTTPDGATPPDSKTARAPTPDSKTASATPPDSKTASATPPDSKTAGAVKAGIISQTSAAQKPTPEKTATPDKPSTSTTPDTPAPAQQQQQPVIASTTTDKPAAVEATEVASAQ